MVKVRKVTTVLTVREVSTPVKLVDGIILARFGLGELLKSGRATTGRTYETVNLLLNELRVPAMCDISIIVDRDSEVEFQCMTYVPPRGEVWVRVRPGEEKPLTSGVVNPGYCRIPPYYVKLVPLSNKPELSASCRLKLVLRYVEV